MKKILCWSLALLILLGTCGVLGEDSPVFDDEGIAFDDDSSFFEDDDLSELELVPYDYNEITVGNPTPLDGQFFTDLWGNDTSDTDVRHLVTGYDLVKWDSAISMFRFDQSVVSGALITDDPDGNRHYLISLYTDLYFSDGTPINAWSYAFSILLQGSPLIKELDGNPAAFTYLMGYEEYASGETPYLAGVHVPGEHMLLISVKKEALPYFYELSHLSFYPYPMHVIAPGCTVRDDGAGAYIANAEDTAAEPVFTAELLRKTILTPVTGYQSHPNPGSGPYTILSYDGTNAVFEINPYYKGNEDCVKPRIKRINYHGADNRTMIKELSEGKYTLLNKVTWSSAVIEGLQLCIANGQFTRSTYPRIGLTYVYFNPNSDLVQTQAVRQAIACCLDRPQYIQDYVGQFGLEMECMVGLGQWMYGIVSGTMAYPVTLPENATKEDEKVYEETIKQWEALTLDGLTRYALDPEKAAGLLAEAGWTLNEQGGPFNAETDSIRCKMIDGVLRKLELRMGFPNEADTEEGFLNCFTDYLAQAGIQLTLVPLEFDFLVETHNERIFETLDLVYLGDNFNISFDPALFFGEEEEEGEEEAEQEEPAVEESLLAVYRELYALAEDMDHTEPQAILEYMRKWIAFQERFTELLPLIPVYSNIYLDFYTRELDGYRIEEYVTWADAIVPCRMRSIVLFDEDTAKLEADLSYAEGNGELDLAAILNYPEHEKVDFSNGALSRFPQEVRDQIPAEFNVIYEFISASLSETVEEGAESIAVFFNFMTPYQEDEQLYLVFGIPGKGSDIQWIVKEGIGLKDGSVTVFLTAEDFALLNGKTFALAVVSHQ